MYTIRQGYWNFNNLPRHAQYYFAYRYRAKNRKTTSRNKEHHLENQSPTDKIYPQEDYYPLPSTTPVSPVPVPAVVSISRMNYDVPYNSNFPHNAAPFPAPQPVYGSGSAAYADIYNSSPHNMMLMNSGQHCVPQIDFANPINQTVDGSKRINWEHMVS